DVDLDAVDVEIDVGREFQIVAGGLFRAGRDRARGDGELDPVCGRGQDDLADFTATAELPTVVARDTPRGRRAGGDPGADHLDRRVIERRDVVRHRLAFAGGEVVGDLGEQE